MKLIRLVLIFCLCPIFCISQDRTTPVYFINKPLDYSICVIGITGTIIGAGLRANKSSNDSLKIVQLKPDGFKNIDRHFFDQAYNKDIELASNVLFSLSFLTPFSVLLKDNINDHSMDILTMYLETMAITGGLYWMSAGLTNKIRPYAYLPENGLGKRTSKSAKNSFYAGHVAVTGAGTFFTAKVLSDYSENRFFKIATFGVATSITAISGYYRLQGGYHFFSDVITGAILGTATGILVPEFHKIKRNGFVSISPIIGDIKGVHFSICLPNK